MQLSELLLWRRRYTSINHSNININGDINIGNSINIGNRTKIEKINRDNLKNHPQHDNIYKRRYNRQQNAGVSVHQDQMQKARTNSERRNDLFADRQANAVGKNGDSWEQYSGDKWNNIDRAKPQQTPETKPEQKPVERPVQKLQTRPQQRPQFNHQQMNPGSGVSFHR